MNKETPEKPLPAADLPVATTAEESFEDALARLETLVKKLESGDLRLEDALQTFEQGIALTRHCQQALQSAEQKVEMLISEQGSTTTIPFPEHDS